MRRVKDGVVTQNRPVLYSQSVYRSAYQASRSHWASRGYSPPVPSLFVNRLEKTKVFLKGAFSGVVKGVVS